ncbi:MAG TPA: type II toxin-antitoxin system RelE/ParE family toxin [Pyrinomonadaceae bacterium]
MNYTFHPHAERELEEIQNYYHSILQELGEKFRRDLLMTVARIRKFPEGWQRLSGTVRRCELSDFPYAIIYRRKPDHIRILAVPHHRRKPEYWKYRS